MNILRLNAVLQRTGLSRTSIYRAVSNHKFPRPIKLGPRATGWIETEIDEWLEQKKDEREVMH